MKEQDKIKTSKNCVTKKEKCQKAVAKSKDAQNKTKTRQNKKEDVQNENQKFMKEAIGQAKVALKENEVPIGAVIVKDGRIVARAHNMREKKQNALFHAELLCIDKACKKLKSWRLENCQMFVTLEPCPMCAGAITNARLEKVTFAAKEKTSGDHLFEKILSSDRLNHTCLFQQDETFEKECSQLLSQFFKDKRKQ